MDRGTSPKSPEAFEILIQLTEMATKHVEDQAELANQLGKAQESMKSEVADFQFPTLLTLEEEAFLEKVGKEMESQYNQEIKDNG